MNVRRLLVGAAIVGGALAPHPAGAQTANPYDKPTTEVKGLEFETRPTEVKGVQVETLPFTGGDVAELTLIGIGLVGVGAVLVRRSRRTAAPTAEA
jgi:uncharacterized surface anchored protein